MGQESSSNELRHDWLSDRWVIFAPQRSQRPVDFSEYRPPVAGCESCPFCAGNESATPAPIAEYASLSSAQRGLDWQVRVVPNKFPAVNGVASLSWISPSSSAGKSARPEPSTHCGTCSSGKHADSQSRIDLFAKRCATGAHEVIIESPEHCRSFSQLDKHDAELVFRAYRDRLRHWANCLDIEYAVLFKNVGYEAGASLVHPHSQLIATNLLPTDVQRVVQRMELFHRQENRCLHCRMLEAEIATATRMIAMSPSFAAFCPFASRFPAQVTLLPVRHESSFESLADAELNELSEFVQSIIRALEQTYADASYNYIVHTAPRIQRQTTAFHWRIEFFPRLTKVAGFEWGSDCYINPLTPEAAAKQLREHVQPLYAANLAAITFDKKLS